MTQDLYYYESGYFSPELGYYIYTADAESQQTFSTTLTASASVIKSGASAISSSFTCSATISHIEGADLFALTNASLEAQARRIRDNNIQTTAQFSVATDAVRGIYISAQADSVSSIDIANSRVRYNEAASSAAFSLAIDLQKVSTTSASLSSNASLNADAERIPNATVVEATGSWNSAFSLSVEVSRFGGIDLQAFGNASLELIPHVIKDVVSSQESTLSLVVDALRYATVESSIDGISTIEVQIGKIVQLDSNQYSLFTPNINCVATLNSFAVLESQSQVVANISRTRDIASSLTSNASIAVSGSVITAGNCSISSACLTSIIASRTRDINSALEAQATISANVYRIKQFSSAEYSLFTPSIDCTIVKNSFAVLDSVASISAIPKITRTATSSVNSNFTVVARLNQIKQGISAQTSIASLSVSAVRAVRLVDPVYQYSGGNYTPVELTDTNVKFGTHSLLASQRNIFATTYADTSGLVENGYAYGNGKIISVIPGTTWITTDLGDTWTSYSNNLSTVDHGIGFVNDRFWAYGYPSYRGTYSNVEQLRYSFDGITWTTVTMPNASYARDNIGYANGLWITIVASMAGSGGTNRFYVYTSPDLTTWTQRTQIHSYAQVNVPNVPATNCTFPSIKTSGTTCKLIFETADTGVNYIHSSTNSTTWTQELSMSLASGTYQLDVEGNNWVYACSSANIGNNYTYGSKQGNNNWVNYLTSTDSRFSRRPLLFNGKFILLGRISSDFGATWTSYDNPNRVDWSEKIGTSYLFSSYINGSSSTFTLSSDATTFVQKPLDIAGFTNRPGNIKYNLPDNKTWDNWNTIDFWVWGMPLGFLISKDYSWRIYKDAAGNIVYYDGTGSSAFSLGSNYSIGNTWAHVRLVKSSTQLAIYINGARKALSSYTGISKKYNVPLNLFGAFELTSAYGDGRLDAIHITSEQLNDPALTSITVPTTAPVETQYTIGLFNFNDTILEDRTSIVISRIGNAALQSAFTTVANASKISTASSSLQSQASVSVVANKLVSASTNLSAIASFLSAVGRIRPFVDIQSGEFTLTSNAIKLAKANSALSTQASISCTITKQFGTININASSTANINANAIKTANASSNLQSQGFLTSAVGRIRPFVDIQSGEFTLTVDAETRIVAAATLVSNSTVNATVLKTFGPISSSASSNSTLIANVNVLPSASSFQEVSSSLSATALRIRTSTNNNYSSSATVSANSQVVKVAFAALNSQMTATITALRRKQLSAQLQAVASELAITIKVGRAVIHSSMVSSVTVTGKVVTGNNATLSSTSSLTASVKVNKTFRATLQVSAFELVAGDVGLFGNAHLTTTSTVSAGVNKIASAKSNINASSSLSAVVNAKVNAISLEMSAGTMTVVGSKVRFGSANLASVSSITSTAERLIEVNANLQSQGFILAFGVVYDPTASATWIVPAEVRSYTIAVEDREYAIEYEERNYFIEEL